VDAAAIEARIRAHIAAETGPRAAFYKRCTGEAQFWGPDQVVISHPAQLLDEEAECQRVSLRVAETYGFEVVVGWTLIESAELPWHCFNLDPATGRVVDAASVRGRGVGYLGKVLLPIERRLLARSAAVPSGRELASNLAETAGVVGGAFSRIFGG
jgi:hypothetical protein